MSTKTTFKRIALVAVAALTLGGFTAIPASANDGNIVVTVGTGAGTATAGTVSTIAGTNNFIGFTLATATTNFAVTVTGGTASSTATTVTGSGTAALIVQATGAGTTTAFTVPTPTVGSIVVRAFAFTGGVQAAAATSTLAITVTAAPIAAGTINVAASTSFITDSASVLSATLATAASQARAAVLTADAPIGASRTAATDLGTSMPVALIQVKLMDTQLVPEKISGRLLTAVITGPGLLVGTGTGDAALAAPAASSVTSTTDTNGFAVFAVYAAGLGGVGTIEISSTSAATNVKTVVATETVTLHGGVAKITPTVRSGNIANSGSAYPTGTLSSTNHVFRLTLTDSDGYPVRTATTVTATAADTSLVSAVTCGSTPDALGRVLCSATGVAGKTGKTTVTFKTGAASTFNLVEATADVTVVSPKAASIVFTGTADTEIGGVITYTVEAKGADGLPVPDGANVLDYLYLASSPTVAGGAMKDFASVAGNAPDALFTGVKFKDGKASDTVQAPFGATTIAADFYATGGGVATSGGTYFATAAAANTITTVKTVVSNSGSQAAVDAAAEATDAANAATDAANAAAEAADAATAAAQDAADAVAALSASVATMMDALRKQITALTNIIVKIQKKVRA
jgi:hypothetical protein